jgi:hypothetical protein
MYFPSVTAKKNKKTKIYQLKKINEIDASCKCPCMLWVGISECLFGLSLGCFNLGIFTLGVVVVPHRSLRVKENIVTMKLLTAQERYHVCFVLVRLTDLKSSQV